MSWVESRKEHAREGRCERVNTLDYDLRMMLTAIIIDDDGKHNEHALLDKQDGSLNTEHCPYCQWMPALARIKTRTSAHVHWCCAGPPDICKVSKTWKESGHCPNVERGPGLREWGQGEGCVWVAVRVGWGNEKEEKQWDDGAYDEHRCGLLTGASAQLFRSELLIETHSNTFEKSLTSVLVSNPMLVESSVNIDKKK